MAFVELLRDEGAKVNLLFERVATAGGCAVLGSLVGIDFAEVATHPRSERSSSVSKYLLNFMVCHP